MANVYVLDTDVIKDIARGHKEAAAALRKLLKSGTQVYISQAAYNQLVNPGPNDSHHLSILKIHYRELIKACQNQDCTSRVI